MQELLSNRINKIEASGIRKIFELAAKNKGEYTNLSIGQPHFLTPENIKESGKRAIDEDNNSYYPTLGSANLRAEIVKKLQQKNSITADLEEVMITSGVAGGIFLALSATIDPGDEVILPDPYFVLYKQLLEYLGATVVLLNTYPTFDINPQELEDLITEKTKLIIINSPSNPTGKVYSQKSLCEIAEVAQKHNLLVLSDEIYESFDYEKTFFSIGSVYKKTITLGGFSKSHSITGWRIGYMHAPKELIEAANKLQQYSFVCAPSFAQKALESELQTDVSSFIEYYKKNRDYLYQELKDLYKLSLPEGAFYAFIEIPKNKKEDFVKNLLKNKLLIVPGKVFSQRDTHFRVSFAVPFEELKKGVEILKESL